MALKLVPTVADDPLSDEALVSRARERGETAVHILTQRFNRRLYRVARSILRDDAEAEDVVQEAFVRAPLPGLPCSAAMPVSAPGLPALP